MRPNSRQRKANTSSWTQSGLQKQALPRDCTRYDPHNQQNRLKVRVTFLGRDAGTLVDLSAAQMVAAEKDNIEESKKGVPSKTKQGRCAEQKKDVIEAL